MLPILEVCFDTFRQKSLTEVPWRLSGRTEKRPGISNETGSYPVTLSSLYVRDRDWD